MGRKVGVQNHHSHHVTRSPQLLQSRIIGQIRLFSPLLELVSLVSLSETDRQVQAQAGILGSFFTTLSRRVGSGGRWDVEGGRVGRNVGVCLEPSLAPRHLITTVATRSHLTVVQIHDQYTRGGGNRQTG